MINNKQKGSAVIVFIIVAFVLVAGGITGAYLLIENDVIEDPLESSIGELLAADLGVDKNTLKTSVTHRNGIYASGVVNTGNDELNFYAVFAGGLWRLVDADKNISCERLQALGFSDEGILNCATKYPNAKAVSEVVSEENDGEEVTVIGVATIADPDTGEIVVSSGGSNISVSSDSSNAEDGDLVVINGILNNDPSGPVIEDAVVEDVGEEDDEIVSENNNPSSGSNNDSSSNDGDEDENEEIEEVTEIPEPDTSPQDDSEDEEGEFNIFDLNQSGQIKIRND